MNINTGSIVSAEELSSMPIHEQKNHIEVKRVLTDTEAHDRQIKLYSPCACGSGKKFKFCCLKKP